MAVTARTLRLQDQIRREVENITDAQTRDLVRSWVMAWNEVEADLTATLLEMLTAGDRVTRAQLMRSTRVRKVLALIAASLDELAATAGIRITGDLLAVIETAGSAQASVVDSQLPRDLVHELVDLDSWARVDRRQVDAIVRRTTEQITSLTRPLSAQAYDVVRRELIRGVASGSNPKAVATRMVRRAEKGFNGGLTRALVVSRTELLDAHRAAAALGQAQHADVLQGWAWLAKLDTRTCPSCWTNHGSVHDLSESGPDDHQQGRCARMPVTKPWSELGLDIPEPPSLLPNAAEMFEGLPSTEQMEILGPARYEAWVRGSYPMDDWSVRRSTPGWRDSYGVAPAPKPLRQAVA
jgi:hypothetical protein